MFLHNPLCAQLQPARGPRMGRPPKNQTAPAKTSLASTLSNILSRFYGNRAPTPMPKELKNAPQWLLDDLGITCPDAKTPKTSSQIQTKHKNSG
jgi:hypothetical protein